MRKALLGVVVTASAVAVVSAAAVGTAVAGPGRHHAHPQSAQPQAAQPFTVVERALTDTTADTGPTGDSLGDVLAFANPIYDAANQGRLGSDNGSCIRTAVAKAYECTWTTTLAGGSLVVSGPFYDTKDSVLAITGGTGKWARAHGEMRLHARNAKGTAYNFSFSVR
jgi:allene oxide cyclase